MNTKMANFAGLSIAVPHGWFDVTDDLPKGSPHSLARGDEGIGVLQFSLATYGTGPQPGINAVQLESLLREFGESRGLGALTNLRSASDDIIWVSGDFVHQEEFVRVWYMSNGRDVALLTYVSQDPANIHLASELADADAMVLSIRFKR